MTGTRIDTASLAPLFAPRSVAIIGASSDPEKIGGLPLRYIKDHGYEGAVYPVNPKAPEIQGLPAYARIEDVPGPIDLAIIAVPGASAPAALRDCAAKGVRGVIMFSAGFAEVGDEGRERQRQLAAHAKAAGMRLLGPNCIGMVNFSKRIAAGFAPSFGEPIVRGGRIGLVSQSGAFASYAYRMACRRGLSLSAILTTGNEADVDVADCIAYLVEDGATHVILLYVEGCRDGPKLCEALGRARNAGKPVVVIKLGRTDEGALAVATHTAALAGSDPVYDALFHRYGVCRAAGLEEFLDVGYVSASGQRPADRSIGIVTVSGGIGALMADEAVSRKLDVRPLPGHAKAQVQALVPYAGVANVVDITGQVVNDIGLYEAAIDIVLREGGYSGLACFQGSLGNTEERRLRSLAMWRRVRAEHPATNIAVIGANDRETIAELASLGCLHFEDPTRAVRALAALADFAEPMAACGPLQEWSSDPGLERKLPERPLNEIETLRMLAAAGLPVVDTRLVTSAAEAAGAAAELGFPVVLKIVSTGIPHKSEVGGVRLGIRSAEEAKAAYEAIVAAVGAAMPGADVEGCLVAPMLDGGVETIIGIHRDPVFGPLVMFGIGGVYAEAYHDVVFRLVPIDVAQARAMIGEVKAVAILEGLRGQPPADLDALARALARLSEFASGHAHEIESLDINPLLVRPRGQGVVALDALYFPHSR